MDSHSRRIWKETLPSASAVMHAMENSHVGQRVHFQVLSKGEQQSPSLRSFTWSPLYPYDSETQSYTSLDHDLISKDMVIRSQWSVSDDMGCLILFEHPQTNGQELLWVRAHGKPVDLRWWALNRNILARAEDFVMPLTLDGTPRLPWDALQSNQILVACGYVSQDCFAVVLGAGKILLLLSSKPRKLLVQGAIATWKDHLQTLHVEPTYAISAMCFVLDAFLLVARDDGSLMARPKSNFKSQYHVEELQARVAHLTSAYNVVAMMHSYSVLEVRRVIRIADDPFIGFEILYRYNCVDCDHAPLLYGPFVVFAGLDGLWYQVMYDGFEESDQHQQARKEMKIPTRPGWKIVAIKAATWTYLTVVAQDPITKNIEELFLFVE